MSSKKTENTSDEQIYFNINQVAKAVGVVPATLRNWEKEGLFTAKRGSNNYRVFDFNDIELLKKIRTYSSQEGMSMSMIRRLIATDNLTSQPAEKKYPKKVYHAKLKEFRELENYTLEDVSDAVGISASYLSRIEQGQANVSLEILEKLSAFYGESMLTFFDIQNKRESALVKKGEGVPMETALCGVSVTSLSASGSTASVSPVHFWAEPGCGDFKAHSHHGGEEFIYVLSGKLQITLDESEQYLLKEGDSFHFLSTRMHCWHNSGKKPLEMIWVHSFL